ncbi:hypothetical protein Ancab_035736 [Ancistrocladus abbreviatus]
MDLKNLFLVSLAMVLVVRLSESLYFTEKDLETDDNLWDLCERWRSLHTVSKRLKDKHKRFDVFKDNVRYIHKVNKMDKPYKLNLNKFADITNDEFKSLYASSEIKHPHMLNGTACDNGSFMYANVRYIPPSIDWRKKGAVTLVAVPVASIDDSECVPKDDEYALTQDVAFQPVSVVIHVGSCDFRFYHEGVFNGDCGTSLNHGVAVVGYGATVDGTKYWKVKNSWGIEWGEKGYVTMERDISAPGGLCGLQWMVLILPRIAPSAPLLPQMWLVVRSRARMSFKARLKRCSQYYNKHASCQELMYFKQFHAS